MTNDFRYRESNDETQTLHVCNRHHMFQGPLRFYCQVRQEKSSVHQLAACARLNLQDTKEVPHHVQPKPGMGVTYYAIHSNGFHTVQSGIIALTLNVMFCTICIGIDAWLYVMLNVSTNIRYTRVCKN
mgnify:CR=1 FL=1